MRRSLRIARLSVLLVALGGAPTIAWAQSDLEEEVTDDEVIDDEITADDLADELPVEEVTDDDLADEAEDDLADEDDDLPDAPPPTEPPVAPPVTPPIPPRAPPAEPEEDLRPEPAEERPEPAPPPRPARAPPLDLPKIAAPEVMTEQKLLEHIEARANYVRLEDTSNADVELGYIEEARRALGARNVVVASAALLRETHRALDAGLTQRATDLAEAAARLSPDLSAAHWMRVRTYWAHDRTQVARIAGALVDLVTVKLFRFRNVVSLLSNVAVLLGLALLGTIALFAFVQLFKYVRYPAHDFASVWPRFVGTGEVILAILILVALPTAFGLGLLPAIAVALVVTMAYQTTRERFVSLVMLVILGLSPAILYVAAPLVTYHGSQSDALASAMDEAFASDAEQQLRRHLATQPRDFTASLILAYRLRQRGDLEKAELEYQRALGADASSALARNNLGVVQFLQGRPEQARATFRAAASQLDFAEPYLNLATIAADDAQFDEANRHLETARNIDPDLTVAYTQLEGGLPSTQKMQEARIGQSLIWARLFDTSAEESLAVSRELWGPIGGGLPPLGMPIVALIAGLVGLFITRISARLSTPCPRCGIPADRGSPAHFCAQCVSVFLTAVAVDPKVRAAKEHQVRRHQRGRRFVERTTSVLAGIGHIYGSRPLFGSLLAFLFLFALGAALFPDGFVVNRWDIYVDGASHAVAAAIALGCAGAIALLSLSRSFS